MTASFFTTSFWSCAIFPGSSRGRRDRVAREVEAVDRAEELVVHLREVELHVAGEQLAPSRPRGRCGRRRSRARRRASARASGGSEARPAQLREPLAARGADPRRRRCPRPPGPPRRRVEEVEVALGDLVDEGYAIMPGPTSPFTSRRARPASGRRRPSRGVLRTVRTGRASARSRAPGSGCGPLPSRRPATRRSRRRSRRGFDHRPAARRRAALRSAARRARG